MPTPAIPPEADSSAHLKAVERLRRELDPASERSKLPDDLPGAKDFDTFPIGLWLRT